MQTMKGVSPTVQVYPMVPLPKVPHSLISKMRRWRNGRELDRMKTPAAAATAACWVCRVASRGSAPSTTAPPEAAIAPPQYPLIQGPVMPNCIAASKPPSKPYCGGSQPCTIQHKQAQRNPTLSQTPNQGWRIPSARKAACPGGYLLAYVGSMFTCIVSKNRLMGCGGFARRPLAKVSPPHK